MNLQQAKLLDWGLVIANVMPSYSNEGGGYLFGILLTSKDNSWNRVFVSLRLEPGTSVITENVRLVKKQNHLKKLKDLYLEIDNHLDPDGGGGEVADDNLLELKMYEALTIEGPFERVVQETKLLLLKYATREVEAWSGVIDAFLYNNDDCTRERQVMIEKIREIEGSLKP